VNLAQGGSVSYYPSISPERTGYGAGSKEFQGFANVVRLLIGSSTVTTETMKDTVCVVETNIDDASGELIGNLVERLSDIAKDVTVISGMTKKSRPTYLIRIISDKAQLNDVLDVLFAESGTLGARVQEVERFVLPRAVIAVPVSINGISFNVHVKLVRDSRSRKITSVKPEFEDIRIIASRTHASVKRTMELVNSQVMQKVG
ncbi:MAG: nickel insertion protein, partial [Nitrososphaera sp.]